VSEGSSIKYGGALVEANVPGKKTSKVITRSHFLPKVHVK